MTSYPTVLRAVADGLEPAVMREVLATNMPTQGCFRWYRRNPNSQWGWEWRGYGGWLECPAPLYWMNL